MELRENMCILIFYILIFNTFILIYFFIVDTASGLKSLFPTVYRFCLDGYVGSCFVVFIYLFLLFIYLFIYYFSTASTVILIFVVVVVITSFAFVIGVIDAFCGCLVIVAASLILMFSILVLLFAPYFTVNSVGK